MPVDNGRRVLIVSKKYWQCTIMVAWLSMVNYSLFLKAATYPQIWTMIELGLGRSQASRLYPRHIRAANVYYVHASACAMNEWEYELLWLSEHYEGYATNLEIPRPIRNFAYLVSAVFLNGLYRSQRNKLAEHVLTAPFQRLQQLLLSACFSQPSSEPVINIPQLVQKSQPVRILITLYRCICVCNTVNTCMCVYIIYIYMIHI